MVGPTRVESLTSEFYAWEVWGRGWQTFRESVSLEPPFEPFAGHGLVASMPADDGHRPSFSQRLLAHLFGPRKVGASAAPATEDPDRVVCPFAWEGPPVELDLVFPPEDGRRGLARIVPWLQAVAPAGRIAFEIVGARGEIAMQLAAASSRVRSVAEQTRAFFPEAGIEEGRSRLEGSLSPPRRVLAVEFGLSREFMLPLTSPGASEPDPLLGLFGTLGSLEPGDVGVLQVLFERAYEPWPESILRAAADGEGGSFFLDAPEFPALVREKLKSPLFAVALRVAATSLDLGRAWQILQDLAGGVLALGAPGDSFVPLSADNPCLVAEDVLRRESHRSGMLLSAEELGLLVHPPDRTVEVPGLRRGRRRTKAAPEESSAPGIVLGWNIHRGRRVEVRLPDELRLRHLHVIGASGSGKSTLLARMIQQDLEGGVGVGVIDPHGDLVDEVLGRLPTARIADTILLDPGDPSFAAGWNVLRARSETEKTLLASDLVGIFRRLATSWGDQMTAVLGNAVQAILDTPEGGTLLDLRDFLADRSRREEILAAVGDPETARFWRASFPLLSGHPQASILTRLDALLRAPEVRAMVTRRDSPIDFRLLMDQGGVLLAKLSHGLMGAENSALVGSVLVSTLNLAALSRQDSPAPARRPFALYIDEFQHFATPSMATLFSGARKYGLGLVVAHQELGQLRLRSPEVASAVLGNAGTRIVFRVGEGDARELAAGFQSFEAADLAALGVGEAICRFGSAARDFNLATSPLEAAPAGSAEVAAAVCERMRTLFPPPVSQSLATARPAHPLKETLGSNAAQKSEPDVTPQPAPPARRREERVAVAPATPGRGGPEHKYLQTLVKQWAEARGFKVSLEKDIPGGRVDLALEREDLTLGCEIAVSSSVEKELAHVEHCLAAGFSEVVVVSPRPAFLKRLARAAEGRTHERAGAVRMMAPEELLVYLGGLPRETTQTVRGYRVRVRRTAEESEAEVARSRAISEVVLRSLRRMKETER